MGNLGLIDSLAVSSLVQTGESNMAKESGGIIGMLVFIGIIVLLNVLSNAFDWGWNFY